VVTLYLLVVAAVAVQRLVELRISRRNVAWARERHAEEHGRGHYPAMVALHTAFLVGCVVEVLALDRPFRLEVAVPMFALLLAAQALRVWCIRTLGPFWNTRVLVVPGAPRITGGPYAYLRHPNYLAVAVEGFALPLLHGAWLTAALFTVANGVLLALRIHCEDRALGSARSALALATEDV
jgi:methyltransferase